MSVIVGYSADIDIEIIIEDRLSTCPGAGRQRRRRRFVAPSCHNLKMRRVIITNQLNE